MVLTAPTGCSTTGGLQQGKKLASLILDENPRKRKGKDQRAYAAASGTLLRFAASLGFSPAPSTSQVQIPFQNFLFENIDTMLATWPFNRPYPRTRLFPCNGR